MSRRLSGRWRSSGGGAGWGDRGGAASSFGLTSTPQESSWRLGSRENDAADTRSGLSDARNLPLCSLFVLTCWATDITSTNGLTVFAENRAGCHRGRPRRSGRLDRRAGRARRNRRPGERCAGKPMRQIGRRRHRAEWKAAQRKLDWHGLGDARPHGPPALDRADDIGTQSLRPSRPFEFPQRAR